MRNKIDDKTMKRRVRLLRLFVNDELSGLSYGDIAQRFNTDENQIERDMQWIQQQDTNSLIRNWLLSFKYDSELILSL